MQLLLFTPENTLEQEIATINQLFALGLHRLHVRKPNFSAAALATYINQIAPIYQAKISIHSHFQLLETFPQLGIHLNSYLRNANTIATATSYHPTVISSSYHSWEEIAADTYPFDYAFISPVFDSISKKEYKAGIDLTKINEIKAAALSPKIMGLGGVNARNIATLKQHCFDGAVLLGAIWQAPNAVAAFEAIQAQLAI